MEMKLLKPWLQIQLLKASPILQEGSAAVPWRSLTYPSHGGSAQGMCLGGLHQVLR